MKIIFIYQIVFCLWVAALHSQSKADDTRCVPCSHREALDFQREWRRVKNALSPQGQRAIFQAVLEDLEGKNEDLANELRSILKSVSGYRLMSKVDLYLSFLTKPKILTEQLNYDIQRSPDWARKALTIIPMTGQAIDKILTKILDDKHPGSWRRCLAYLGKSVMRALVTATLSAKCRILRNSGLATHPIEGVVSFSRKLAGGPTSVRIDVRGFTTNNTKHAFHIHKFGRLGDNCNEAGPHFNPMEKEHGAPEDEERHVGDLGNVEVDGNGRVIADIRDDLLELSGPNSIVGKSVVFHEFVDDLGLGGFPDSKTTGHAGRRIGCCVIEGQ
jgi:superoxide dismutase, Cu-Zn family